MDWTNVAVFSAIAIVVGVFFGLTGFVGWLIYHMFFPFSD